jgi:outer membrane cobalamin receptor
MRKFLLLLICALATTTLFAQTITVTGTVIDVDNNDLLIGVSIIEKGTTNGVVTDLDGNFTLAVQKNAVLQLSYVGYQTKEVRVQNRANLGTIELNSETIGLEDVTVTGQMAIQRKTPVAVSQVAALEIEERLGGQEFPEVLKNTPGVHANKQGGGWGDSEIYMRGFASENVAVMVNGIPMNDMENGTVYWSNWQGLSDVTSVMQTQRGLGASKVSAPSVGGTINVVTKGIDAKRGGFLSYAMGNDGYNKIAFSVSTGLMKNGWAITLLGSRTWGDGYIQGTGFEGYNYFANVSKRIGENHQLSFTAFGAPQKHWQRSGSLTMAGWQEVKKYMNNGMHFSRYNATYGYDDFGHQKSGSDYNQYHKPQISLNHVWQIDHKSSLSSVAYVSIGRGFGNTAEPGVNSSYAYTDLTRGAYNGALTTTFRREDGTFDYGKVMSVNALVTDKTDPRYNADTYTGSQLIIAENRNYHNWVGLVSTYSTNFLECIDFYAGLDVRYYNGIHQAVISDMMGGEYFIDATRTTSVDPKLNYHASDVNWRNEKLGIGDVVYRNYEGRVMQEGVFAQAEYNKGDWAAFLSGSLSCTSYKRIDHFYYDEHQNESDLISFAGGTIKTGFNYNINKWNNVFVNVGYISRAPKFSYGAFMSSNTSNVINKDAKNEQVASAEVGYGFHNEYINVMVNGYFTEWLDKAMTKTGTTDQQEEYYMNMTGVNARHMGIEFEMKARPTKWLELSAMFSWGDWTWDSDSVKGYMFDEKGTPLAFNDKKNGVTSTPASAIGAEDHAWAMVNMKGIHVGGSAQTTANVGIMFKPFKGFRIGGEYTLQARNYSYYSFNGSNLNVGKSMSVIEPLILPVGGALDLRASYHFEIGKCDATISGNINNLLDQYYIEKAWNPSSISSTGGEANMDNIHFFYSYGRTFNLRLKVAF